MTFVKLDITAEFPFGFFLSGFCSVLPVPFGGVEMFFGILVGFGDLGEQIFGFESLVGVQRKREEFVRLVIFRENV